MGFKGGRALVLERKEGLAVLALLAAMLVAATIVLAPAWSQQKKNEGGKERKAKHSLNGVAVKVQKDKNRKNRVDGGDVLKIPGNTPRVAEDATVTVQDGDGTRAKIINNENATFSAREQSVVMRVEGQVTGEGGDGTLNTEGIQVTTGDGITVIIGNPGGVGDGSPGGDVQTPPTPAPGGQDQNDGPGSVSDGQNNSDGGDGGNAETPEALPQDEDAGPLVGARAIGEDVLVPGDVIGQDPETGEDVVGIDRITISAENCEVVDEENLTVTLDDQGEPFRVIDGVDVDITVDDEGVTIEGRERIQGTVNGVQIDQPNPDQLISGFEVEQDDTPEEISVNDTFPVVSTTGIGGEGCAAVANADTTPDTDTTDDVDTGDDLPNTGGGPADTRTALLFVVSGLALLALRVAQFRRKA